MTYQSRETKTKFILADFYLMDFMKSIVILVKVDEVYNILKWARQYRSLVECGIGWSTFLLESALQCTYVYYVPTFTTIFTKKLYHRCSVRF